MIISITPSKNGFLVKAQSILSFEVHEREMNFTYEQFENWRNGMFIQNAMPQLTPTEREFLLTGITDEEWDEETEDFLDEEEWDGEAEDF